MAKIKYISLEKLKKQLDEVIADVQKNKSTYIVMKNKEPVAKITPTNAELAKELVIVEESKKKLKKFVD